MGFLDRKVEKAHIFKFTIQLLLVYRKDITNMGNNLLGNIVLEKYFIAYIDVLGYKEYVYSGENNALHLSQTIRKTIDFINARNVEAKQLDDEYVYKFRCFSDNFILCSEKHDNSLIEDIAWLQFNLALDNVFVRGSFSFGELHFDNDFIFGKGIINAHKLESSIAIYPRVVVDSKYLLGNKDIPNGAIVITEGFGHFKTDFDGAVFIDYLNIVKLKCDIGHWSLPECFLSALEKHRAKIMENIAHNLNQPAVLQKYLWLRNYHNSFCLEHDEYGDVLI